MPASLAVHAHSLSLTSMVVLDYVIGMLVSLLPERSRGWYASDADLYRAAMVSGMAQYFSALLILFTRYVYFMQRSVEHLGGVAVARGREEVLGVPAVQYGMGFVILTRFLLHPVTLLLFYMALEGLVRFAAAATREVLGTLPLCLTVWMFQRVAKWMRRTDRNPHRAQDIIRASANK